MLSDSQKGALGLFIIAQTIAAVFFGAAVVTSDLNTSLKLLLSGFNVLVWFCVIATIGWYAARNGDA